MASKTSTILNFLIIFSMIIWGGSWVSAKAIANSYNAYLLTFLRFFVSCLSFIPILFFMKTNLYIDRRSLKFVILGSLSMGLYFYFFFKGLERGYANVAGVFVTSLIPIYTLLLSKLFFKRSFRLIDYLGIFLGFLGGAIIMKFWKLNLETIISGGNIYFIICPLLWALVTISSEKSGERLSPLTFSFYCYLFCSILFFILSPSNSIVSVLSASYSFWLNILYLSIISSTIATTIYFYSTTKVDSFRASTYAFIVPSSSLILSVIFLGERPQMETILGGIISIFATYLINFR